MFRITTTLSTKRPGRLSSPWSSSRLMTRPSWLCTAWGSTTLSWRTLRRTGSCSNFWMYWNLTRYNKLIHRCYINDAYTIDPSEPLVDNFNPDIILKQRKQNIYLLMSYIYPFPSRLLSSWSQSSVVWLWPSFWLNRISPPSPSTGAWARRRGSAGR